MKWLHDCAGTMILILGLALLIATPAIGMDSSNYSLDWDVLASAGGDGSSTGYDLSSTAGQPTPIGQSSSTAYRLAPGFWTGAVTVGEVIDIQGSVTAGGAPVVDTLVKLRNLTTKVVTKTRTDAAGSYQYDPVSSGNYKIIIGPFTVGTTTTVSGTLFVKGAPSVGTKMKLKNLDTGAVLKTTTDASGNYSFANVGPGRLKVTVLSVAVP